MFFFCGTYSFAIVVSSLCSKYLLFLYLFVDSLRFLILCIGFIFYFYIRFPVIKICGLIILQKKLVEFNSKGLHCLRLEKKTIKNQARCTISDEEDCLKETTTLKFLVLRVKQGICGAVPTQNILRGINKFVRKGLSVMVLNISKCKILVYKKMLISRDFTPAKSR